MEWSKLKTVIILILALLNAFLLFLVMSREIQDTRAQEQARQDAIAVIQSSGVILENETVPRTAALQPQMVTRDLDAEGELARRLLGEDAVMEARGGEVYLYRSSVGSIQFHSTGDFLASFSPGAFPLGGQDAAEHAASVLERLDFTGQPLETSFADGEGSITLRQLWNGAPLLDCQATLNYEGGELISITGGRRLPGTPYPNPEPATISVPTALMRLFNGLNELGDVYNEIRSITQAYTLSVTLSDPAALTPVWFVETDTGSYRLDLVSAQLTRASDSDGPGGQDQVDGNYIEFSLFRSGSPAA